MLTLRSFTPTGWVAAVLAVLLILALAWLAALAPGREHARSDLAAERANAAVQTRDAVAREAAADARLADAAVNAARQEDLAHAVQALPDTRPSDRRRALACARLRHQGTDTAAVPACGGPNGGGETAP